MRPAPHDAKRHGAATWFAALARFDGTVIGQYRQRHRHREFISLVHAIARDIPPGKVIHVVPTSCAWLNAVEGVVAKLTKRRLKRGVVHAILDLQHAITAFIETDDQQAAPVQWRAKPDDISAGAKRGHQLLKSSH